MRSHTVYRTFTTQQRRQFVRITDDVQAAVARVRRRGGAGARLGDAHHRRRLGQRRRARHPRGHARVARQARAAVVEGRRRTRSARELSPDPGDYRHHRGGEDNGDAHFKNLLVHHQVVLPITDGQPGPRPVAGGLLLRVRRRAAEAARHQGARASGRGLRTFQTSSRRPAPRPLERGVARSGGVEPSGGRTSMSSSISKPLRAQQRDELAVRQVELDRVVVAPLEAVHAEVRAQQAVAGRLVRRVGHAEHVQRRVDEEHSRPPGRSSRAASGIHAYGSHQMLAPYSEIAKSKLASGYGTRSALPRMSSNSRPCSACSRARGVELRAASCRCRPAGRRAARATPTRSRCRSRARSRRGRRGRRAASAAATPARSTRPTTARRRPTASRPGRLVARRPARPTARGCGGRGRAARSSRVGQQQLDVAVLRAALGAVLDADLRVVVGELAAERGERLGRRSAAAGVPGRGVASVAAWSTSVPKIDSVPSRLSMISSRRDWIGQSISDDVSMPQNPPPPSRLKRRDAVLVRVPRDVRDDVRVREQQRLQVGAEVQRLASCAGRGRSRAR